jgi:hypothetical protein
MIERAEQRFDIEPERLAGMPPTLLEQTSGGLKKLTPAAQR